LSHLEVSVDGFLIHKLYGLEERAHQDMARLCRVLWGWY
jgi:hypothetical protein